MTANEKKIVARLREHVARAQEVRRRDHSRIDPVGGIYNAYAFDFGSLEQCVEMIASEIDQLTRSAGI